MIFLRRIVLCALLLLSFMLCISAGCDDDSAGTDAGLIDFDGYDIDLLINGVLSAPLEPIAQGDILRIDPKSTEINVYINGVIHDPSETYTVTEDDVVSGIVILSKTDSFSITFEKGELTEAPSSITGLHLNDSFTLPDISDTREKYYCTWAKSEDGDGLGAGSYKLTYDFIRTNFGIDTSLMLYQKWEDSHYRMTFKDVSGNDIVTLDMIVGDNVEAPGIDVRNRFYNAYWVTANGIRISPGMFGVTGDLIDSVFTENYETTLTSMTEKGHYKLSFGQVNGIEDMDIVIYSEYQIPVPSVSKNGYRVDGWNTASDGSGKKISPGVMNTDEYLMGSLFNNTDEVILYPNYIDVRGEIYAESAAACFIFLGLFAAVLYVSYRRS